MDININKFLFKDVLTVKGVGKKLKKYLKKKNIEKVKDLLFDLPYGIVDRSKISSLEELEIGKIANIKVKVIKYNFPRVRNLPSKVICSEGLKKINLTGFSRSINLTAISFFPNESSQVLAVLVQPDSHLNYLHEEIEKTAVNIGCGSELKAYRPHITLGRFKEKDRPQYEFGVFQEPLKGKVKQLDVLESEFNKGKTEYRVLESLEF